MNREQWRQFDRIVDELEKLDASERQERWAQLKTSVQAEIAGKIAAYLSAPRDPADRFVGRDIGPYRILRLIGQGAMGAVYEAQATFGIRVAVKTVNPQLLTQRRRVALVDELKTHANLDHPHIANVFDAGFSNANQIGAPLPYFVMRLVVGRRAITDYAREQNLDNLARLELMLPVLDAVHHAHQREVVHGDLKPETSS